MLDHRPIVGIQGTCLRFFDHFLTNDNLLYKFSGQEKAQFLDGHMWLPHHDALLEFEKLFREYSWLILLHGSISIPGYIVEYIKNYQDEQIDFGELYTVLIEELNNRGLLDIVQLDDFLSEDKMAEVFKESSDTLYDLVTRNIDYFFPARREKGDIDRLFEISDIGDYILSERVSIAIGRPSLYVEGHQRILSYAGSYEMMKDLSCILGNYLLPNIPIIESSLDLATAGGPVIKDKIKAGIDRLEEIKESSAGQTFRTIASQVLNGAEIKAELKAENISSLKEVLRRQKTIKKLKKIAFYAVAASGAVGFIEPITGGISLVASVMTPLIVSYGQKKAWQKIDKKFSGINYLYEISKDLHREFVINNIGRIEDRFSG